MSKEILTKSLISLVSKEEISNPIFVLAGITPYVDIKQLRPMMVHEETFDKELSCADRRIVGREIFNEIFNTDRPVIISHQQLDCLLLIINRELIESRVITIYDNIRSLFSLPAELYVENISEDGFDERPEDIPSYQAEQIKIGNKYFYSYRREPLGKAIEFFSKEKELASSENYGSIKMELDITTYELNLDLYVNNSLEVNGFNQCVLIKKTKNTSFSKTQETLLKRLNALMGLYGGALLYSNEEGLSNEYESSELAVELLHKYWGEEITFRDINMYRNPDAGNDILPISQGQIVDIIFKEYRAGKKGSQPRDIFITAPTGAGKSLLFQLPSFYASENGDVTIVVSPLKALMKDQVDAIIRDRGFSKVAFLNSDQSMIERNYNIEQCKNGSIDILYMSPELLLSYDISFFIGERKLGLLVIDEAHLITTWGRDFRVDYWFLGNHIQKIRRYSGFNFPMVAVTATAVYGGTNDMVFDSISNLNMNNPHKFIGSVRRDDIKFLIDNHSQYSEGRFDASKVNETASIAVSLHALGVKTLIYCPFQIQVESVVKAINQLRPNSACAYYGKMDKDHKAAAVQMFRDNHVKIMVATKAFGMGIDIPDIQVIYHHAPSGILPDYVQEIGRAARSSALKGFASLTFSPEDLRYGNQLYGMSSIKPFQLRAVLGKIIKHYYRNGKKANMLISPSDFGYIFNNDRNLDQKVATALMMIEKDYLVKSRINFLIARPKQIFTQVYACVDNHSLDNLINTYGNCYTQIYEKDRFHYINLNLEKIWREHFSNKSFPVIKSLFYKEKLFKSNDIDLRPQVKVVLELDKKTEEIVKILTNLFQVLKDAFYHYKNQDKKAFKEVDLKDFLLKELKYPEAMINNLVDFVLYTYSQIISNKDNQDGEFLQRRSVGKECVYLVKSNGFEKCFSSLLTILNRRFCRANKLTKYLSSDGQILKDYIRLGSLLEILKIGSFDTMGGDEPKIFVRINDPYRIEKDAKDSEYKNSMLESVKLKHDTSCKIFEYFFTNNLSNEARWGFIEGFFLGYNVDSLISKYSPNTDFQGTNLVEALRKELALDPEDPDGPKGTRGRSDSCEGVVGDPNEQPSFLLQGFEPKNKMLYDGNSILTLKNQTFTVSKWVENNPVLLYQSIKELNFRITKQYYDVLISKLKTSHFDYYKKLSGLKLKISYPGYDEKVIASLPYTENPVKFYEWWLENKNELYLSLREKINLFDKVFSLKPKALRLEDKKLIKVA